jgi:hypothetical protein
MTFPPMSNHTTSVVQSPFEATTQRTGPTKSEWERYRSQITRLYLDEHMKLKEVMAIMKEHDLNAT